MRAIPRATALAGIVVLVVAFAVLASAHETPGERCAKNKLAAAAKKIVALTACDVKALRKGSPVDPKCVAKVESAFTKSFIEIEAASLKIAPKGVGCTTTNDAVAIELKVEAHRVDLQQTLDDVPPNVFSKCTAAKIRAAGKKGECKIDCNKRTIGDPAFSFDDRMLCLGHCFLTFETAFIDAEEIRPSKLNGSCFTTGDGPAVEAKVDAFVADVVAELPTAEAPTIMEVAPTHGKVGDTINVFGDHLTGPGNAIDVKINGTSVANPTGDEKTVAGQVATGTPTGAGTLVVTTPAGHADAAFTVDAQ